MRVFISSTYRDLVDYRAAVIEQLDRMKIEGVKMELFGASPSPPTQKSLEQLESCDVYLGIIGHRYGSLSPDGEKSITNREYDHAYARSANNRMRILIYLADNSVPLLPGHLENDDLRSRQQAFRTFLEGRYTVAYFSSPSDLAVKVAADLYWLDAAAESRDVDSIHIFDADEMKTVEDKFDTVANERLLKIEEFMRFVGQSFGSLFNLEEQDLNVHPFFRVLHEKLRSIIPGIYLDDAEGVLSRTGVRHVIMRAKTLFLLLEPLSEAELFRRGRMVGEGAASDLIEYTVKRGKLLPSSSEALVLLWGYWDRTGGWGKIAPADSTDMARFHVDPAERSILIRVENNFLQAPTLGETHRLCNFWCGYIHGFFESALPQIADLMADLSGPKADRVTLPAYHKVSSVIHMEDENIEDDFFKVIFQPEPLSQSLASLRDSRWHLKAGKFLAAMRACRYAIKTAEEVLGKEGFSERIEKLEVGFQSSQLLGQILRAEIPPSSTEGEAKRWFEISNIVVKHLSRAER